MSSTTNQAIATQSNATQIYLCDHCGLEVPESMVNIEDSNQFCCGGCQVAYETIQACGLDDYYTLRDQVAKQIAPSTGAGSKYIAYDSETFRDKYSHVVSDGIRSIELQLEGVHCAACLWLIERLPSIIDGVMEARLNMQNAIVRIVWNTKHVPLSRIALTLDQLGYAPHPARASDARKKRKLADRTQLIEMGIAGALAGNCMLIAVALYAGMFDGIEPHFKSMFRWLSMLLGMTSLCWPGRRFFSSAIASLRARAVNLDVPISIALASGAIAGTINLLLSRGDIYFDSLSVLVFLLLVGRYLQVRQQRWAEDAVSISLSMMPTSCRLIQDNETVEVAIEDLEVGNLVEVRSGEIFPADGIVQHGNSTADNSLLTGESVPVSIQLGDQVYSGVQNLGSTIQLQVESIGSNTRIGKLMRLVEEGASNKPPIVSFTDKIAGYFVLAVSVLALVNFLTWSKYASLALAIDHTVALLIVACPCALGLATPLTIALAIGKASRHRVLVKDSAVIEQLGRRSGDTTNQIIFDKTGTLTQGDFSVIDWHGDTSIQPIIKSIEQESNHPIAKGIVRFLSEITAVSVIQDRQEDHRLGCITAQFEEQSFSIGSPRFAKAHEYSLSQKFQEKLHEGEAVGCTVVLIAIDQTVVSVVWLRDENLPDALESLEALRSDNWECHLLSGDAKGPVQRVAKELGIASDSTQWSKSPEDKLESVKQLRSEHKGSVIVMIGDGVNDSASLAAADVGIAVHGGAEASLAAADVYIQEQGTLPIVGLVHHCRQTMRVVYTNLGVSIAYNFIAVSLAAMGMVTPLVAAILMPISSATVLGIAIGTLACTAPFKHSNR